MVTACLVFGGIKFKCFWRFPLVFVYKMNRKVILLVYSVTAADRKHGSS